MANHKKEKKKDSGAEVFYGVISATIKAEIEARFGDFSARLEALENREAEIKESYVRLKESYARFKELENELERMEEISSVELEAVKASDYTEILERMAESLRVMAAGGEE